MSSAWRKDARHGLGVGPLGPVRKRPSFGDPGPESVRLQGISPFASAATFALIARSQRQRSHQIPTLHGRAAHQPGLWPSGRPGFSGNVDCAELSDHFHFFQRQECRQLRRTAIPATSDVQRVHWAICSAYICGITGNILSRHTGYEIGHHQGRPESLSDRLHGLPDECESHARAHWRICMEAGRRCEQACAEPAIS